MLLLIIALFVSSFMLLAIFRRRHITYFVCLKSLGLTILVFSIAEYIIKLSTYVDAFPLEHSMYVMLFSLRMPFKTINIIENIGFLIFMFSGILYCILFGNFKKSTIALMCIPIAIRAYISTLSFGQHIYFYSFTTQNPIRTRVIANDLIITIQLIILVFYAVVPYVVSISNIKKSELFDTKRNNYAEMLICLSTDAISALLLFVSEFRYFTFFNLDLMKYPNFIPFSINNTFFISTAFIIALVLILTGLMRYTPMRRFNPNFYSASLDSASKNTIMLLHTYKNAFCTIGQYADMNNAFMGDNKSRLPLIKKIADEQFEEINNLINIARGNISKKTNPEILNVTECIDNALSMVVVDDSVLITKNYLRSDLLTLGNKSQIIQSFCCVIKNGIEATASYSENPEIIITAGRESSKIYINITDNGTGIKMSNRYKIFIPLFSLKMGGGNFGVGLTYSKRVIESHGGSISFKSRSGKFTTFQISLPAVPHA